MMMLFFLQNPKHSLNNLKDILVEFTLGSGYKMSDEKSICMGMYITEGRKAESD